MVELNYTAAAERYREVALHLGCWRPELGEGAVLPGLLQYLRGVGQRLGLSVSEHLITLREQDVSLLAGRAVNDPCLLTNPRWLAQAELEVCYGRTC